MFGQFEHREDDELKPLKVEFPTLHQGLANILENCLVGCIPNTHAIFNHKTWFLSVLEAKLQLASHMCPWSVQCWHQPRSTCLCVLIWNKNVKYDFKSAGVKKWTSATGPPQVHTGDVLGVARSMALKSPSLRLHGRATLLGLHLKSAFCHEELLPCENG